MTIPKVGAAAPAFSAEDDSGATVKLAAQKGSWVVLFFYPVEAN